MTLATQAWITMPKPQQRKKPSPTPAGEKRAVDFFSLVGIDQTRDGPSSMSSKPSDSEVADAFRCLDLTDVQNARHILPALTGLRYLQCVDLLASRWSELPVDMKADVQRDPPKSGADAAAIAALLSARLAANDPKAAAALLAKMLSADLSKSVGGKPVRHHFVDGWFGLNIPKNVNGQTKIPDGISDDAPLYRLKLSQLVGSQRNALLELMRDIAIGKTTHPSFKLLIVSSILMWFASGGADGVEGEAAEAAAKLREELGRREGRGQSLPAERAVPDEKPQPPTTALPPDDSPSKSEKHSTPADPASKPAAAKVVVTEAKATKAVSPAWLDELRRVVEKAVAAELAPQREAAAAAQAKWNDEQRRLDERLQAKEAEASRLSRESADERERGERARQAAREQERRADDLAAKLATATGEAEAARARGLELETQLREASTQAQALAGELQTAKQQGRDAIENEQAAERGRLAAELSSALRSAFDGLAGEDLSTLGEGDQRKLLLKRLGLIRDRLLHHDVEVPAVAASE